MDKELVKNLLIAATFVLAFWCASFAWIYVSVGDWEVRGQLGDMFGAVNSLFSGLAFAGLIVTLILQRKDLNLQRESIQQTNEQLGIQAREFEIQNQMAKQEQFRNTFFELLRMQQTITGELKISVKEWNGTIMIIQGRKVFEELFTERDYKYLVETDRRFYSIAAKARDENDYEYISNPRIFSFLFHYFRFVYRIIKYVDETDVLNSIEERYQYVAFLRSTLSNYEVAAIFYNCLSSNGKKKFKPLVEKYALFDNIDVKILGSSDDLSLFEESAYKFKINIQKKNNLI